MKLNEVAPTKAEKSLKRIVAKIKKEHALEFKRKNYEISWEMVSATKGWIEIDINDPGLVGSERHFNAITREIEQLIRNDPDVLKADFEGGSDEGRWDYALFSVQYAANLK